MKTRGILITVIFFILLVASGLFWLAERRKENDQVIIPTPSSVPVNTDQHFNKKTYSNSRFGISFEFPAHYFLEEKELGDARRYHRQILLTEDTEENRLIRQGKTLTDREGPTAITIDIYQNNRDKNSVSQWVRGSNQSNFKLGDGSYATSSIDHREAIVYQWSGLYEGETRAIEHNGNIIAFSVTYLTEQDSIREDLSSILASTKLRNPEP